MYEQFFGLEDEPFRLTPDPRYLFLSPKHAEAMAHLRLGLTESSGFVCITGDVGTGKTTLLRAFLSELGPNVAAVYAYVPPLSAVELLRRICREFGLPGSAQSQSELVDELHAYLVAQHRAGRLCVVVLDEAQALSIELLEQIRLLLNLETETQKLLRIVLVGQPQLRKILLDPGLAQLNQRITLRWHLGPLSYRETAAYVRHRLAVASHGRAPDLFTRPALHLLYGVAGGVPRLINMIAHRALLAAFVGRQPQVNRRLVARAYREIQAVPLPGSLSRARKAAFAAAGLAIGVALVAFGGPQLDRLLKAPPLAATHEPVLDQARAQGAPQNAEPPAAPPADAAPAEVAHAELLAAAPPPAEQPTVETVPVEAPAAEGPAAPEPAATPAPAVAAATADTPAPLAGPVVLSSAVELAQRLQEVPEDAAVEGSTNVLLAAWGERLLADDETSLPDDLDSVAWRRGLQELPLTGNRSMLRLLDLPALIALRVPGTRGPRYVALTGMDRSRAVLSIGEVPVILDADLFERVWSGEAHVLWRDFDALGPSLRRGDRGVGVAHLQRLLKRVGAVNGEPNGEFDLGTETAVLEFQRAHWLEPDGIVGPLTRIVLYASAGGYPRPALAGRADPVS
jgi:general secretion pathway protein A